MVKRKTELIDPFHPTWRVKCIFKSSERPFFDNQALSSPRNRIEKNIGIQLSTCIFHERTNNIERETKRKRSISHISIYSIIKGYLSRVKPFARLLKYQDSCLPEHHKNDQRRGRTGSSLSDAIRPATSPREVTDEPRVAGVHLKSGYNKACTKVSSRWREARYTCCARRQRTAARL